MEESRYDCEYWHDDEVEFTKRSDMSVPQDGRLKSDGRQVRRCDGCPYPDRGPTASAWKLLEEFPKKPVPGTPGRASLQYCYFCNDVPKPAKKPEKGGKFSTYSEYVNNCKSFKTELESIRSEYQAEVSRLKSELEVVRAEYSSRRLEVLQRQKEAEQEYRESARKNF